MTFSSRISELAFAALLVTVSCSASAGLLDAWNKLADAGHDVITLGQHGRDRDRERAEKDAQAAAAAAKAAEDQRQLQIAAITKDVALLRDVTRSFESSYSAIEDVIKLQSEVTKTTQAEITKRQASSVLIEKVRDYFRSDNDDLLSVVKALDTDFAQKRDMEQAFGKTADVKTLDSVKTKQDESISTIKAKLEVLKTAHLTEDAYLEESTQRLNTSGLEQVLAYAQKSRIRLSGLSQELEQSRKEYRDQLTTQLDALAVLANSDRAKLAIQYETGLKPAVASAAESPAPFTTTEYLVVAYAMNKSTDGSPEKNVVMQKICMSFGGACFDVPVR